MITATAEIDVDVLVPSERMHRYRTVRVSIECIGPLEAVRYMKLNKRNRNLNARHVSRLGDAMIANDWWMNGETIIFDSHGNLLNGQHRLSAVICSGVAIDAMVVRGINEEAFRTLDGGKVRTSGEVLSMDGEKNGNSLAAAAQALVCFVDSGGSIYGSTFHGRRATPSLTARVLEAHPNLRDSVSEMRRNSMFRTQHGCMLYYLFWMVNPDKAKEFAAILADGHGDIGRPFVIFRETLVRVSMRTDLRRAYCAKAIKAFNAELSGDRPKMLKFLQGEEFPAITGLDYEALAESIG